MGRRIVNLTLDNIGDLPAHCRSCVFWELDPLSARRAVESGDPRLEKEAWLSAELLEWGSCGRVIYVDGVCAAYVTYAPPAHVPRSSSFPTSPVSPDAVQLITAQVADEYRGQGLGRVLVQTVAKDLLKRGGIKAIEAFGVTESYVGRTPGGPYCVVPAAYLSAVGFKTVRHHHRFPRMRLELRTTVSWREDVEVALERLLGSMRPERVPAAPMPGSG